MTPNTDVDNANGIDLVEKVEKWVENSTRLAFTELLIFSALKMSLPMMKASILVDFKKVIKTKIL